MIHPYIVQISQNMIQGILCHIDYYFFFLKFKKVLIDM